MILKCYFHLFSGPALWGSPLRTTQIYQQSSAHPRWKPL